MAQAREEFTLIGYSNDLDKRPLKFVEPIPPSRICSACGNIPRLMYYLLCGHTLCEPCYESCATPSECACPLDGEASAPADVISRKYPTESLLRRKVHCWNEVNGCGVVLLASQVAEHVRRDCQYHVTCCPTCSITVLSRDVCAHLKSRCAALVLHAAPEPQPRTDNNEDAHYVALKRQLKQRVRELDASLVQLSLETGSQNDRLVELCHNTNHLNETLKEQFWPALVRALDRLEQTEAAVKAVVAQEKTIEKRVGELDARLAQLPLGSGSLSDKLTELEALTGQIGEALDRYVAEIKALYAEKIASVGNALTSVPSSVRSDAKTHQMVLTGYVALKEKAVKDGWSIGRSDKVYVGCYLMYWGIRIYKDGNSMYVALCIQLHEGREDDFLEWLFTKEMDLSIIHPETRQELHIGGKPSTGEAYKKSYSRPIGGSNTLVYFIPTRVESSYIERNGYVKGDQLLLRLKML